MNVRYIKYILLSAVCMTSVYLHAQDEDKVIDKVIAVVGDEIVLKSDLETQYLQMVNSGYPVDENTRCRLFEEQLFQALLLHRSKVDSVDVSDEQVEEEMDRRMRYFIRQLGSEKKLEEFYNKSITEIKADLKDLVKDQLLIQKMQQQITSDITITPSEVRAYFNRIPKDSLPLIESEVEIAQIVKKPVVSEIEKEKVVRQLEEWRERILRGEDFGTLAFLYSQDPGSKDQEGELGFISRGEVVPEFAAVAFSLKPGEISDVIKTEYGYHIIQMIERRGDQVNVRHILRKPVFTSVDMIHARNFLDSITRLIDMVDTLDFATAATLFSDDKDTKNNGGLLINPATGTSSFSNNELNQADPTLFPVIDALEAGEISKPVLMQTADGSQAYRIVLLKKRTKPHRANLTDDYQRIKEVAESEKRSKAIGNWIEKQSRRTYIRLDDAYKDCALQYQWKTNQP